MRYPLNTVPLNGGQVLYGSGVASISLTASGFSNKQKYGISTAAISRVTASGTLKKAKRGQSGKAPLVLTASGALKQAVGAIGTAPITVTANYGIPSPKNIANPSGATHPSRELRVPADGRIVDISPEGEF